MLKALCKLALPAVALGLCIQPAQAREKAQDWELINPAGLIEQQTVKPAKRITSLNGKTIVLHSNGKFNSKVVLDYLASRLGKQFPSAKLIKTYSGEMGNKNLNKISATPQESARIAKVIASVRPDIVIASQAD